MIERIVTDIGEIVRMVRFDGWQNTHAGELEVRKNLRRKYAMADEDMARITAVFSDEPQIWPDKAYRSALCGVDCVCPGGRNPHHTCQKRHIVHGSAVFVTSVFGMVAAAVAVRQLAGLPPIPAQPGRLGRA